MTCQRQPMTDDHVVYTRKEGRACHAEGNSAEEDNEEVELELKRRAMRERVIAQKEHPDLLDIENEASENDEEEVSSEYKEYESGTSVYMGPLAKFKASQCLLRKKTVSLSRKENFRKPQKYN